MLGRGSRCRFYSSFFFLLGGQIGVWRNVKILPVVRDLLLPKKPDFLSLFSHVGSFTLIYGSGQAAQRLLLGFYRGQTGMRFLWKCQSGTELEREGPTGNQLAWNRKEIHPDYDRMSFCSLRNSNLHLLLRKLCRCLFASPLAASSLGSTVCSKICRLNPDLHTLAKQRKTVLVSVFYISAFAKVLELFFI